jgi:hypothetical protein
MIAMSFIPSTGIPMSDQRRLAHTLCGCGGLRSAPRAHFG